MVGIEFVLGLCPTAGDQLRLVIVAAAAVMVVGRLGVAVGGGGRGCGSWVGSGR